MLASRMTAAEDLLRSILAARSDVRLAILFGSLATGKARAESDVDIAVDLGKVMGAEEKIALIGALAEATGRPIDLVDLRTVGEPLLGQILQHGKRLLGEDTVYAELIKRHLFNEADFMPYYRRILEERRRAWIAK